MTYLSTSETTVIEDTFPWSTASNLDHLAVVGAMKSLLTDDYLAVEELSTSFYTLTPEAESILQNGSQEILVLKTLLASGRLGLNDLQNQLENKDIAKIGMANCMKNKWIKKDGADLVPVVTELPQDEVQLALQQLASGNYAIDAADEKVGLECALIFSFKAANGLHCSCFSLIGFVVPNYYEVDDNHAQATQIGELGHSQVVQGVTWCIVRSTASQASFRFDKGIVRFRSMENHVVQGIQLSNVG